MDLATDGLTEVGGSELPRALDYTWSFLAQGGMFMVVIALCSFVALVVIVYKFRVLRKGRVLPEPLVGEVEHFEEHLGSGSIKQLQM